MISPITMDAPFLPEEPKKPLKPFKLCFVDKNLLGKSEIHIGRPLKLPPTLTDKFYTGGEKNEKTVGKYIVKLKVELPREKYPYPLTENQKYGWYHDQVLIDVDRSDRRLYFHKQPDILIKEHLMNYAKIRD